MSIEEYIGMMDTDYQYSLQCDPELERLEWLAENVFQFCTDESEASILFATKAIEVCRAISDRTTYEYIERREDRNWFLIMLNMPFFRENTDFGTSIRGSFWSHSKDYVVFGSHEYRPFTPESWEQFIQAAIQFPEVSDVSHNQRSSQPNEL